MNRTGGSKVQVAAKLADQAKITYQPSSSKSLCEPMSWDMLTLNGFQCVGRLNGPKTRLSVPGSNEQLAERITRLEAQVKVMQVQLNFAMAKLGMAASTADHQLPDNGDGDDDDES